MYHLWLIMKLTFKDGIRSRVLYGISFIAFLLFASNLVITSLFAFELGKVMIDVAFAALTLAGLSIIFFLGINILSQDIHNKTVYMILSRPVNRGQYIIGKFGGLVLVLITVMIIMGALAMLSFALGSALAPGAGLPRNFSWLSLIATVGFRMISFLIILSIAFFFTIISSSMYLAMLFTFCVYFIGNSIETISKILVKGDFIEASPLYIALVNGIAWVFPNLSAFDLKANIAYGLPYDLNYMIWTGSYGFAYIFLILLVTLAIFKRKDLC